MDLAYEFSYDLYDQLATSPETRFHAVYLFIRYLLRVVAEEDVLELGRGPRAISKKRCPRTEADNDEDEVEVEEVDPHFLKDATRTVIWDIAVGCLALSVKVGFVFAV
jgi:hypothetical protein